MRYVKPDRIVLKGHPELRERWVQDRLAKDPSLLGLGDLILKDKERIHPQAGRLDLLFQDPDSDLRYEAEIQLGRTDVSRKSYSLAEPRGLADLKRKLFCALLRVLAALSAIPAPFLPPWMIS